MSILFLDHDGVLCLAQNWGTRQKNGSDFDDFDQKAVDALNYIIMQTGCFIVVSSDWRHHTTLEEMRTLYFQRGVKMQPIGFTPNNRFSGRASLEADRVLEIQDWLSQHNMGTKFTHQHPNRKPKWCAVDDMNLSALGKFVRCTDSRLGLAEPGIKEQVIKLLL